MERNPKENKKEESTKMLKIGHIVCPQGAFSLVGMADI